MNYMRSIGAVSHAIIDYALAILLLFGPEVGHFAGKQAILCRVLGALLLIMSLLTRYPLGAFRLIGFVSHGVIELILGVVLLVLPWTRGFSAGVLSRNFFVAIAVLMLLVWILTDFRAIRGRVTSSSTTSATTTSSTSTTTSSTKTS